MTASTRNRFVIAPVVCALLPLVCIPAAEWLAVAPFGSEGWLSFCLLFFILALVAVPAFYVALVGLCFRRTRRFSFVVVVCSAAYCGGLIGSVALGQLVRMQSFHRLADRSKPLVAAVRAFEQKHGHSPPSLAALVPDFLPAVPSTGMGAYPKYNYITPATNYSGNPWVITVFTPSGGINFDQFIYFPLTNYPKRGYGGWLERVGDWAYVHE